MSATPHTPSTAKGYDDSPPRNGTIFFYTVVAISFLIAVKFLLDSYFVKVMDGEIEAKVLTQGMDEVAAMRAAEAKEAGAVSAAMKMLGKSGREAKNEQDARVRAALNAIKPENGQNKAAIEGWRELKRTVAPVAAPAPAAPVAPVEAPADAPAAPGAGH